MSKPFPNWYQALFLTLAYFIFQFVAVGIFILMNMSMASPNFMQGFVFLLSFIPAILIGWRIKIQNEENSALIGTGVSGRLLIIVAITGISFSFLLDPLGMYLPLDEELAIYLMDMINESFILAFVTIVVFPAVFEELLFRRIILDGLAKNHNPWLALVITSLIFGLIHLNIAQAVGGFFGGLFLGWIYLKTNSIIYPIVLHALHNLLSTVFFKLGYENSILVEAFDSKLLIFSVFLLLTTLFIAGLRLINKSTKRSGLI